MIDKDLVLGYDLGTSSVKAAIFTREGRVAASSSAAFELLLPRPGWAEQRPDDWWSALAVVTHEILRQVPEAAARVAAIAISAQMCGVVPVDAKGRALANCLIWMDTRSNEIARKLMRGWISVGGYGVLQGARWLRLTGGAPNLSGKDPISKILWLKQNRSDIWPAVHKVLDVKDYLLHRCTGRFATTYDCAHLTWLFDSRQKKKQWAPALLRQIDLDEGQLPEILRATDVAGGLTASAAEHLGLPPGTPVAAGLGDVSAAAAGAGNPAQGSSHLYVGTSSWFGSIIDRPRVDVAASVGSICCADAKGYLLIATQENAGASLSWARQALGFEDFGALEDAARRCVPRPDTAMFFPWLSGERVPVDNERIRGSFAALSLSSSREDLAFAAYEGVALNARWAMGSFDKLSRRAGQALRIVGGGARSKFWSQLFADVLQRDVEAIAAPQLCGALGSAMVAAVCAGWHKDLVSAAVMAQPAEVFSPNRPMAERYAERFGRFAAYYRRVRPWHQAAKSFEPPMK